MNQTKGLSTSSLASRVCAGILFSSLVLCGASYAQQATDAPKVPKQPTSQLKQHTYRIKVVAFDASAKKIKGEIFEQTQMEPGMWVDTGTQLEMKVASIKHNPEEIRPGVVLLVTNAFRNGHWEPESVGLDKHR